MTQPTPEPPAALAVSIMIAEPLTLFSPAGPIQATLICSSPIFFRNVFSVS